MGRLLLALSVAAAAALLPVPAAASNPPPKPCEVGYVAPTPTAVPVTAVPITVTSTTADYFVLYLQIDPADQIDRTATQALSLPILVKRGEAGTTTLADNLKPFSADRYRVEKYAVAQPGDLDGDCVDDLTELADLGRQNPINPAKTVELINGAVSIDSFETFQELSLDANTTHFTSLGAFEDLEFLKFEIRDVETDNPTTYFLNTNTTLSHGAFRENVGLSLDRGTSFVRGEIVYYPNLSAPDGTLGIYRYSHDALEDGLYNKIATHYEILAAAMPFLENELFYYPSTSRQASNYKQQKAKFDASRINVILEEELNPDVDFVPLNQAEGYGRLRLMADGDRPSPFDVAIYQTLPNDLPRVAGTITTVPQTPLSHVNLRAIQNGLPNAYIRDALEDDAIKALIGSHVYFAVTADGYAIRSATKQEVDAHHAKLRPKATQTLQRDLTVTTITSLANVSFADWTAFGVKAANVAELTKLPLPAGTTPVGFAVPFYFYDEFMKQATLGSETILGKKKAPPEEKITLAAGTTLSAAVSAMLAHSYFQTDLDIQEEMLDDLRDAIKDATSPKFVIDALTAMHAKYPDGQSLRYRSSTNNEDLPSFNGAGLYSSKTQDPDETTADGVDKSIKAVWASLWNYRAFLERDFHRVDHSTVAMGVLVHPNYSDELVNGVAVSYDPISFRDNAYYVNSQVGEDLVTNPEANSLPEQLLLGSTGAATELSRSNLAPSDKLLMTDAQMRQLRSNLETIHNHFKTLYQVQDGDDYAIEVEFKITAANKLAIKQARPWIFAEPLELSPSTVTVSLDAAQATEGAGLELTATRSGGILSTPLTIDLTWSETGSMLENATPPSVTIPSNQTSTTIAVPIDDDTEDEHDSDVTVTIAANSGYTIGTPGSASATVTDDDLTNIAVRADARAVTEGQPADFTLTRSGSILEHALTVPVAVSETGSRIVGALPTEVVFAANSDTATMSFATVDDSVVGENSEITVQIGAGSGYGIVGAGSAKVTVQDDELPGPTLLFAADHAVSEQTSMVVNLEIQRSSRNAVVTFTMGGPDAGAFVLYGNVDLLLFNEKDYDPPNDADGDGVYEIDFTATESGAGSTTERLRFTVTNDELVALTAQQWDQLTLDQRVALLPEVGNSPLKPAFASLQSEVKANVLRLGRQQQLPSPGPTVSVTEDGDVAEGGTAGFAVTADPAPTSALSVTVNVTQSGDYGVAPASHTVTIPTTGSVPLTITTSDDDVDEADGSVTATVIRGSGYIVSWTAGAAVVVISDDDDPPPSTTPEISIAAGGDITEGGDAVFTLTANPAPAAALDVAVSVAQSGDFGVTAGSRTVTVATSGTGTLTVATGDDSTDEADGTVTATVADGADYDVSPTAGAAVVVISDDDDPPPSTTPEISIAAGGDISEGGDAVFTLTANPAPAAALDVAVSVAQSGDFGVTAGSRTVTVATSGTGTLTVATGDDSTDEADGTVTATVADGADYDVSPTAGTASVAVADDDAPPLPTPEISIAASGDITEGGNATFTLTANPAPAAALDVAVSVAQSGDFGVTAGSRTVAVATSGTGTLTVATGDDSADEADGSVTVTVADGADYDVSTTSGSASVAVADDDDPPPPPPLCTPQLPSDAVTVGEVTGWRDGHSGAAHVLRWNRVLEALGEDTGTSATAMTATESEANESQFMYSRWDRVTRTLEAIEVCDDGTTTTTVVPPPTPEISIASDGDITEGGSATFTLTANPAPTADLDVDVTVAQSGDFGVTPGSHTVTVATSGTGTLTVATTDDSTDEADGSVTAAVTDGTDYDVSTTSGSASVAVVDDDDPPPPPPVCTPNLPSDAVTVGEVTGWRDGHSGAAHVLRWNRVLEALGTDTGTGAAAMTAAESEDNESLFMFSRWDRVTRTLEALEACGSPPPPPEPEISIAAGNSVTEGGSATFTLSASPAPSAALTVDVTVVQQGDFGVTTGSRTVAISTSGSGTLTVTTSGDSVDEADGSVTVTVDDGNGYTVSSTAGSASVTVSDDDNPPPPPPEPEIAITAGNSVVEGGSATFTLTASPVPTSPLAVDVTVAQQGNFGVATGSRTVAISTSGTGTLTVTTSDDSTDEPDGSVTVTVDDGAGYTVSTTGGTATVAVSDDDPPTTRLPPSQVSFSAEDASATEGETLSFRVVLSAAANARVRVYWRTRYSYAGAHSAFPDVDYPSRARGWLAFEPGDTEKWVDIALPHDTRQEPSEVFQIYLSFTEGGATIADRDATMTIHDND